jgi:transcriptional regulator with XRE-family HTH domain
MDAMSRSFGEFLRRLRTEKKKTQRDLAGEVGVSFTYLSKLENEVPGFSSISEGTLRKLAAALDTDPDEMITRAGKVPSDVQRILIEDFSLIREIRDRQAGEPAGGDDE